MAMPITRDDAISATATAAAVPPVASASRPPRIQGVRRPDPSAP